MTDVAASLQKVIPGNAQHIGARSEQQDSFGFSAFDDAGFVQHAGVLAVVADGMGGLALGKDSSAAAVQTFLAIYATKEPEEKIADVLDRALHSANRAVNRRAAQAGVEGEAGTTLVAAVIYEGKFFRISAGDSRIYHFRDGRLRQITTDYNYGRILDKMVEKGEMSAAEASSHPSRAALTSYLGKEAVDDYDHPSDLSLELVSGDKILLASDGLFGFLQEEEIVRLMEAEPQTAAEALVHETVAKQSPYQDNVTVAILGYDLPPAKPLAETQIRRDETVMKTDPKAEPSRSQKSGSPSGKGKWLKIAVILLALAAAGFLGGKYFGEQVMEPDPLVEKTEKAKPGTPKASPEKTNNKSGNR